MAIVCSDQNLNLLKSKDHSTTDEFVKKTLSAGLLPSIQKPTRVTKNSSTLIDNIYIRLLKNNDYKPGVIVDDISDHFPCFVSITNDGETLETDYQLVKSRKLNDDKMLKINQDLLFHDWSELYHLSSDVSLR